MRLPCPQALRRVRLHDRSLADGSRTPSGRDIGSLASRGRLVRRARPPGGRSRGERRGGVPAPARRRGDQQRGDGAAWWTLRRDTVSLRAAAARGDSLARHAPDGIGAGARALRGVAAAAYLTLARADTAGAIRRSRRPAPRRLPALLPRSGGPGAVAGGGGTGRGGVGPASGGPAQRDGRSLVRARSSGACFAAGSRSASASASKRSGPTNGSWGCGGGRIRSWSLTSPRPGRASRRLTAEKR